MSFELFVMPEQEEIAVAISDTAVGSATAIRTFLFDHSVISGEITAFAGAISGLDRIPLHHPTWYFLFLFVLVAVFAWTKMQYGPLLQQTVMASVNFQISSRMFQDNSLLQLQLDTILYIVYLFSFAFLLFVIQDMLGLRPYGLQNVLLYLFNLGILTGFFLFRIISVTLVGFLFNRIQLYREHFYNEFIYNKLLGIGAIPVMILLPYTEGWLKQLAFWAAIALIISVYVARIFRGVIFSLKKDISIFYMFLYLCALEIVPLLLLYRWLKGILLV